MDFLELAKTRYTERKYSTKALEEDKLQMILEAGRIAPTAKNIQCQKVYVVQSKDAMDKIRKVTPCHYGAPLAMIICYDKDQEWHNPSDNKVTSGVEDASIVATHMMMEAADLDVHTTWVNMFNPTEIAEVFELPKNEVPVLLMMFGYPENGTAPAPLHTDKKPLAETVQFI